MHNPRYIPLLMSVALMGMAQGRTAPSKNQPTECKLEGVMDAEQSRGNAFTYLIPKGWTPYHQFSWAKEPGSFHAMMSASTPDQMYGVTQMQEEIYRYNYIKGFGGNAPMVTNSPVHHATEFLHLLLNQILKGSVSAETTVEDEVNSPLANDKIPEWMKKAPAAGWENRTQIYETGYLQVKFIEDGQPKTAMLGTTIKGYSSVNTLPGRSEPTGENGFFVTGPTTILIMPSDASPQRKREMRIIADSVRMTPQFLSYMRNLVNHLVQIKTGAYIAGRKYADSTFHERTMAQFNEQMKVKDAQTHAFCNYISNQQDYKDQNGQRVTVPTSFSYGYSDGAGNYLFNDDPTTDLRGIGNGNWKPMQKAPILDQ